ncbi:MAG: hypothetical protein IMW89_00850 [Ktedonobacteraceae bacterium]|nr:hypothetical protein [Ktedonobacteraceae bacterium]
MAGKPSTPSKTQETARSSQTAQQGGWRERLRHVWQAVRQFLWGFFMFEMFHETQKEKARYSDAVNLVIAGELLGLPLMNSVITLRLLPYLLPELAGWKQRQLAEEDIIEEAPEIH